MMMRLLTRCPLCYVFNSIRLNRGSDSKKDKIRDTFRFRFCLSPNYLLQSVAFWAAAGCAVAASTRRRRVLVQLQSVSMLAMIDVLRP